MMRFRHLLEAAPVYFLFGLLRLLPLDAASAFGGWLGRSIGPKVGVTRTAKRQLRETLFHLDKTDIDRIIVGMWDGLGRIVTEFPHLGGRNMEGRVTVANPEKIADLPVPRLYVAGHLSNWEVLPQAAFQQGTPIHILYRPTNNRALDALLQHARKRWATGLEKKGAKGARGLHRALEAKTSLGLLIDQKENNGVPIRFMGKNAMTGTMPARLAIDHGLPIIPTRVVRLKGARFEVSFGEPIRPRDGADRDEEILRLLQLMHGQLEGWIREHPEQWFWVHHRWPREKKPAIIESGEKSK